ncbi:MAG: PAS domain S-box protein [Gammaproteobacteria bacterium]
MPAGDDSDLNRLWIYATVAVAAAVCVSDLLTPLGFAHGTLYVLAVAMAGLSRNARLVVGIGVLAALATVVGGVLSAPPYAGFPSIYGQANRLVSLLAIAASCWLALGMLRHSSAARAAQSAARSIEASLAEQRALVEMAGAVGHFGGWSVRLADGRVVWSGEVARIFGQAEDAPALSMEQALDAYLPEYQQRVREVFTACAREGVPFDEELALWRPDGTQAWVRSMGRAVRDGDDNIVEVRGAFQDISARRAAELSLDRTRHHFRLLADSLPIIVWTADADGTVDYHNKALIEYTGIGEEAWTPADRWLHLVHPEDLEHTLTIWEAVVASGQPYLVQFRLRRADGVYRWFVTRAVADLDSAGRPVKWYGSATDIDDQKQLEAEARAAAQRLTTTLESITEAFVTLNRDWQFTFLNGQAERLLAKNRHQLLGCNVWELFPDAVGTRFETAFRQAVITGRSAHFEAYYAPFESWLDVSAFPSHEGLAIYFRDVSADHAARNQLHLLQSAVARLGDIIVIAEAVPDRPTEPRIVFVNDAFERVTGFPADEVIGRPLGFTAGEGTAPAELERIHGALAASRPVRTEILTYGKTGEEIWLEINLVPLADDSGRYTHWVSVERDITQRMSLEDQLRQSQRLEAVGHLTGGVAHDFNNLLTVILGNAEVLVDELMADRERRALAEMIAGAALRGAELTGRLLAFARKQALDPRSVNVNELVGSVEPLLRRTLGEHIDIELVRGGGLWPALIDPGQLEDALLNLSLNARDAMPGGGRLTIETSNTRLDREYAAMHAQVQPGQYVLVAVSDTGQGIPAENLRRVFEPFFTTKEKGKGTGLGLSMVYGFIKQSEGHINIYSEPGEGTTVKMYLPRVIGTAAAYAQDAAGSSLVGGTETILLVEDDDLVRRYARNQLAGLGYRVLEAGDGAQALALVEAHDAIDLLFTDVVMPGGMSGRELADRVHLRRPGMRVLFTSGYTENAIVHQGRLDAGVQLLSKPYRRAELARAVRAVLDADAGAA